MSGIILDGYMDSRDMRACQSCTASLEVLANKYNPNGQVRPDLDA
jgi:hypothetical protein